jgi:RNA polymerase sigma-70 factor, ECF subfamily
MRILRNATESEDVAQIVFMDIYRARDLYDASKGSLRTWVLQYAYRRAINYKHALDARAYYRTQDIDEIDVPSCGGVHFIEAAQIVHQALGSLGVDQQTTLRMIFLEGAQMEDVAAHLQQNVTNIRHHYYRGLRKLREVLQQKRPPERRPSA